MRRDILKKLHISFLFALFLFVIFAPQASARSLSIDDVHIRVYIAPDGNLLVNEMFTYTFNGSYETVRRSLHAEHHDGVKDFEAYELMNPEASLGFMNKNDLRQLDVKQNNNNYIANLSVNNESKKIVFLYILENAVKSYETYSDMIVPFFGTDNNHDTDLQNVTIDFVFPDKINPDQYYAYFHDKEGYIVQKTEEAIRFFTPVSKMKNLTETRLLFPSAIMTEQQKQTEPMSLEKVLKEEEEIIASADSQSSTRNSFSQFLPMLAGLLTVAAILLLLLPQRRIRSYARPEGLLTYDPLYLYVIDRAGEKDSYAFLAGVYSLIEKGCVTAGKTMTLTRFQRDPEAPKNTLSFTFRPSSLVLSESENLLLDWLFTRKQSLGMRIFSMNNIYGPTKSEKEAKNINGYGKKHKKHLIREDQWFNCVLEEFREKIIISDKLYPVATRILLVIMVFLAVFTYFIGAASGFGIFIYLVVSAYLLPKTWRLLSKNRVLLFFLITLIFGWISMDTDFLFKFTLFIFAASFFYITIPRFILTREASEVRAEIRGFRKSLEKEGIPSNISESELEKWMTRAVLLKVRKFVLDTNQYKHSFDELERVAPMTALILHDEDPVGYLLKTWKWSAGLGTPLSEKRDTGKDGGDGGGSYSSDSSGDGGGDGGGAGAD